MYHRGSRLEPDVLFIRRLRWPVLRRRALLPSLARGSLTGALAVLLVIIGRVTGGDNLHMVQAGRAYRAAQMSPVRLERLLRDRQIRTIVNLRGYCPEFDWYRDECRVTHEVGIAQEDVTLSALRLPAPAELRRLVEVLDRSEKPILMHCRQGVDRTGLASAVVKLLEPGNSFSSATRQLSLGYGYVPFHGTENMQHFLELYSAWLNRRGLAHSSALFRHWATREYCPGLYRGEIEFPDWSSETRALLPNRGWVSGIRVRNTSVCDWRLRTGAASGIHVRCQVINAAGTIVVVERAGQFDSAVAPGESIDLELGIPPLPAGNYVLTCELAYADQNSFSQFGVEPTVRSFRVGP